MTPIESKKELKREGRKRSSAIKIPLLKPVNLEPIEEKIENITLAPPVQLKTLEEIEQINKTRYILVNQKVNDIFKELDDLNHHILVIETYLNKNFNFYKTKK